MAEMTRENDLILKPNEFAYILDLTKGGTQCGCGPFKLSMSASDQIVSFDETTKRLVPSTQEKAIRPFVTVKENDYVILTNPAKDGSHPRAGTTNNQPELLFGKSVVIHGPASFALYPYQEALVIAGHVLRSSQYLLVEVYDTSELNDSDYEIGERIIIRGDKTPFFIPTTGLRVVPDNDGKYVRDAVTLDRLEYAQLLNEQGEMRYVKGPAIAFPEADETFIINDKTGKPKFRAIELSDISGIYLRVIARYEDEDGTVHEPGEELFITGKDQKIFYPRPEVAIISYDGKILHHAIAIPSGEGRYVLHRLTGDVKTVKGPRMYLPDPRTEVIVKRKLSEKECKLWYPGNKDVLKHNDIMPTTTLDSINELSDAFAKLGSTITTTSYSPSSVTLCANSLDNGFLGQDDSSITVNDGFNRGNTYSKPRTITIDNKYDGVVTIEVWTGYAINVVGKDGKRKTIVGPQTYLMEYDETLEVVRTADGDTVFLRVDNDRIDDVIHAQTKDFVDVDIAVTYCVNFTTTHQDKWFSIKDYADYLIDHERSNIKKAVKEYCLEEFYSDGANIVKNAVTPIVQSGGSKKNSDDITAVGKYFSNGMYVDSVEVLNIKIANNNVREMLDRHQANIVAKSLELSAATKEMAVTKELEKLRAERLQLEYERAMNEIDVKNKTTMEQIARDAQISRAKEDNQKAIKEAEKNLQPILDAIQVAELARDKKDSDQTLAWQKEHDKLEVDKQKAYTDAVKKVVDSISPELVAAITTSSKADMIKEIAQSLSPYALASENESVADLVDKLLRGSGLEGVINLQMVDTSETK